MKLKNAGIKTEKEMYYRMLDGEAFHFSGSTIFFDGCNFFSKTKAGLISLLNRYAEKFQDFQIEVKWEDRLNKFYNPLCWVSNVSKGDKSIVKRVIRIGKSGYYISEQNEAWIYAELVKTDDLDS